MAAFTAAVTLIHTEKLSVVGEYETIRFDSSIRVLVVIDSGSSVGSEGANDL